MSSLQAIQFEILKLRFYLKAGLQSVLADRALVITDLFLGTIIPYSVQFLIWTSVYKGEVDTINGYTYHQTIFYYAFALAFGRLNNSYDVIEGFSYFVQEGKLEAYLAKPVSYPLQRMFQFLGESIVYLVPLSLVLLLFYLFSSDAVLFTFQNGVRALILIAISQLLCFQIGLFLSTLTFWVVRSEVILSFMISISTLLGGTLLPPEFWPNWLLPLMKFNPFRFMIAAPAEFIVAPSTELFWQTVIGGGLYSVVILAASAVLWKRGLNYYNGAGG